MLRKVFTALLLLIAVLAVSIVLLTVFLDKEQLVATAAKKLKEETGAELTVGGDVNLSFYPIIGVSLADAAITMPEKTEPDLVVGALKFGVLLKPLFSGEVAIDSIVLNGLQLRLESSEDASKADTSTMSDAQLNNFYAQRRKDREEAGASAGAEAALALPLALNVSSLLVTNARIEMLDPQAQATVIDIERLQASGLNLDGQPIPLQLAVSLPGEQPIDIDLQGSVRIEEDTQLAHLDDVAVEVQGATAETARIRLTGVANISRQTAKMALELDIGATNGKGEVRYASFESPQIDADLHLNLLDPALLLLAGPDAAGTEAADGDGSLPLDALRGIDTRAALRVDAARWTTHTVNDMVLELRALEGVIDIKTLTGELHGGQLDATGSFDGRLNLAKLNTRGALKDLDIARAVAATEASVAVTGGATLTWQLASDGRTSDALIANLTGPIKLDTQQVTLQGTNVEHLLCKSVALANQQQLTHTFSTDTAFDTLGAQIQLADGLAVLQPLQAQLPRMGLTGKGDYDITSGDFNLRFKASLSPELEELDPACEISKRLTDIEFPVNCRGNSAGEPGSWCRVDAEQIIKDLAINQGRKKIEKKANKFLNEWLEKEAEKKAKKDAEKAAREAAAEQAPSE